MIKCVKFMDGESGFIRNDRSIQNETVQWPPEVEISNVERPGNVKCLSFEDGTNGLVVEETQYEMEAKLAAFSIAVIGTGIAWAVSKIRQIPVGENRFGVVKFGDALDEFFGNIFARVSVKDHAVTIKGINYRKHLKRIEEMYKQNNLTKIFDIRFNKFSLWKYNHKLISKKRDVKIHDLQFDEFFAMEIYNLFSDLYDAYGFKYYLRIAESIRKKSYLKDIDKSNIVESSISNDLKHDLENNPLLPHQEEFIKNYNSLKKILSLRGIILSFDQGLGKTLTSLALAENLNKKQVIVICPKTMCVTWADEIVDKFKSMKENLPESKNKIFVFGDKLQRYGSYDKTNNKYLIVNNESVQKILPYIDTSKPTLLIIDECQNFRNIEGVRWDALYKLITQFNSDSLLDVLPMSGTPIKASPSEISPALMCIDPLFTQDAARQYAKAFEVDTTEAARLINQRFSMIIYRKKKSDVLSLPEKHLQDVYLQIKDPSEYVLDNVEAAVKEKTAFFYNQNLEEVLPYKSDFENLIHKYCKGAPIGLKTEYLKYLEKTIVKDKKIYISELTSEKFQEFGTKYIRPNITDKKDRDRFDECERKYVRIRNSATGKAVGSVYPPRIAKMFCDIISENSESILDLIDSGVKKTALLTSRLEIVDALCEMCDNAGLKYVKIVGDNAKNRPELLKAFKEDDDIDVLIGMHTTMGVGVTITEANQEIIFGTPWRMSDFNQLADRIHRIGQTSECYIYTIKLRTNQKNLSDRLTEIMNWSGDMVDSYIENLNR